MLPFPPQVPGPRRAPATPGTPVSVERLEDRDLPSGLTFQFQIDDPTHQFAAFPLLQADLNAVGQILSGALNGLGTIQVRVRPNNAIPRSSGSTVGVVLAGTVGGVAVYEPAALAEAQTGVDPNGTGPEAGLDFISVALHEMTHALGFQGYRAIDGPGYGTLPPYESNFDALTAFGTGGNPNVLYFTGPRATAVYGGPVPLTSVGPTASLASQNFYHVGNPAGLPGSGLVSDLMNGMVFSYGTRYTLSTLDLAILADQGWSVPGFPGVTPAAPQAPAPVPRPRRHRLRQAHHVRLLLPHHVRHHRPAKPPFRLV